MSQNISKPIRLQGSRNTRELGGYRTEDGKATQFRRYLRSDGVHALTEQDKQILYRDHHVRCVLDLRTPQENEKLPDRFPESRIHYANYPLIDSFNSAGLEGGFPPSMEALYKSLLENSGKTLAGAFREMLRFSGQCVLFHCAAGKDRTGVLAMLLLKLAGVPDETVIADYAATQENMADSFAVQRQQLLDYGVKFGEYVFESRPESMERTLIFLRERFGSAERYLWEIGLTREETGAVRQNFTATPLQ